MSGRRSIESQADEPEEPEDDVEPAPEPRADGASRAFDLVVPPALSGERLDRALAQLAPSASRAAVQRWIEAGRVEVDGRPARASAKVQAGSKLRVEPPAPPPSAAVPEELPLEVLHEDPDLVVIDKAAGMVVHPAAGHATGTLVSALLFRYGGGGAQGGLPGDAARPGIVHRLDKGTSGVMVVARTEAAHRGLSELFASHDVERSYLAIALGTVAAPLSYDTLHGRHPTDRKRFSGRVVRGRRAVTRVEPLEDLGGATLVRCTLETGRTHQIRVHLSEGGHPILGDRDYGKTPRDPRLAQIALAIGRPLLHAAVLGFRHPTTGAALRFEAPPPADFGAALEALRATAPGGAPEAGKGPVGKPRGRRRP